MRPVGIEPDRVDRDGVDQTQRLRSLIHHRHEASLTTANIECQSACRIVCADDQLGA